VCSALTQSSADSPQAVIDPEERPAVERVAAVAAFEHEPCGRVHRLFRDHLPHGGLNGPLTVRPLWRWTLHGLPFMACQS
jgi:hypothetical protein